MEKGIERGFQQGFQQALAREAALVLYQINERFRGIPQSLEKEIRLPIERVEELAQRLFDFEEEAMINWLNEISDQLNRST